MRCWRIYHTRVFYFLHNCGDKLGSWGQHGAYLGPAGPRWASCWPHELCYLGCHLKSVGPLASRLANVLNHFSNTVPEPFAVIPESLTLSYGFAFDIPLPCGVLSMVCGNCLLFMGHKLSFLCKVTSVLTVYSNCYLKADKRFELLHC